MGSVAELGRLGHADAILWVLDGSDRACRFYALAGWAEDGARKTDGAAASAPPRFATARYSGLAPDRIIPSGRSEQAQRRRRGGV